jgi:plasmid stabilization system protein ParE
MDRSVEFHEEAVEEARAAYMWYSEKSKVAAEAFLSELDRAVEEISEAPKRCPSYFHGTRRYLLRRFPFFVVYREVGGEIEVVAVAHGRRRPGYWKDRQR